jgi:hypothetical protein
MNTKKLALCGVFAGLALALMWMISFVPSMDYALPAMAGMLTLLLVTEAGSAWAIGVYFAVAVLALLLLPNKGVALLYAALFGYYPVVKLQLEHRLPAWIVWMLKFLLFNAAVILAYYLAVAVFGVELDDFGETFGKYAKAVTLAIGNVAFWTYDMMILSTFAGLWKKRWRKKLQRWLI